ncbi:MAG TPA: hypothetical protein VHR45_18415 [Thermoanaerobaculia bacterium]|nr:hypothetical protein [Thermoanaerobaculia bacterium]
MSGWRGPAQALGVICFSDRRKELELSCDHLGELKRGLDDMDAAMKKRSVDTGVNA